MKIESCLLTLLLTCPLLAGPMDSFLFSPRRELNIQINNRILAKVNGKAISVMDVTKKMDLLFYRQFPQYSSNASARYQFYQANWKYAMRDLIDKELVMADAEESQIKITNGDIRQEMETLFGPNIIQNLNLAGLTFDEAWEMIRSDLILKRMLFYRVNAKVIKSVTPKEVKIAYDEMAKTNKTPATWNYQIISFRGSDPNENQSLAAHAFEILSQGKVTVDGLRDYLQKENQNALVNVSDTFSHQDKEISDKYKTILSTLETGSFSQPLAQKTKDNSEIWRIFYLKNKEEESVVPFHEVELKLKEQLLDQAMTKEQKAYLDKLHKHFHIQETIMAEMIPDDFQPFILN